MVVGAARVVLRIAESHSLKDKRKVLKSVIAQLQQRFQISVAEVDRHDQWQIGVIGIACVSTSARHADEVMARALTFLEARADAEVVLVETESVHVL